MMEFATDFFQIDQIRPTGNQNLFNEPLFDI